MTGKKRTNKKTKFSARQLDFAQQAKKLIQPQAENLVSGGILLADYLSCSPEADDKLLLTSYEKLLRQDIHDNFEDDPELVKLIPRLLKNHQIRISGIRTKISRANLDCRTFQLKLVTRNASREKRETLARKFLEGKWLRNDIVAKGIDGYDTSNTEVEVLNKKTGITETRNFQALSAQERQSILAQIEQDISSLAKKKAKGHKVGKLRFCREMKSIPLKQLGKTFHFDGKSNVHIAGVGWLAVRGIDQIRGKDIASATIVKVGRDYYLHVTVYQERKPKRKYNQPNTVIAVDMGVADGMTCSEGTRFNLRFDYTETYRKLHRKLSRQQRGSRGWWKTLEQLTSEAAKTVNARDDAANKAFAYLCMNETVITQDDPLPSWTKKGSRANGHKKVPIGILGRIKEKCRESDQVVMLDRYMATTRTCPYCGEADKVELSQQGGVICPACHRSRPRNVGACWTMEAMSADKGLLPVTIAALSPHDESDGMARAKSRCAWTSNEEDISSPIILDRLLGHIDDVERNVTGCPENGDRKNPLVKRKWTSKKLARGKLDKWSKYSRGYAAYAIAGKANEDTTYKETKAISVNVPAGRGELTLVEMMSGYEKEDLSSPPNRSNRRRSQKPLPIL